MYTSHKFKFTICGPKKMWHMLLFSITHRDNSFELGLYCDQYDGILYSRFPVKRRSLLVLEGMWIVKFSSLFQSLLFHAKKKNDQNKWKIKVSEIIIILKHCRYVDISPSVWETCISTMFCHMIKIIMYAAPKWCIELLSVNFLCRMEKTTTILLHTKVENNLYMKKEV